MLYDTRTSRRFFDSDYDEEIGTALSWSPDSGTLAIGKRDLHLVDLRRPIDRSRWRELDTIQRIPDPAAPGNTGTLGICDIQDLAYSPDGRSLAVATETHLVLYDVPRVRHRPCHCYGRGTIERRSAPGHRRRKRFRYSLGYRNRIAAVRIEGAPRPCRLSGYHRPGVPR